MVTGSEENPYLSDHLRIFDFRTGSASSELATEDQFGAPRLSVDGRFVALAEGRNWADPNWVIVFDRREKRKLRPQIPSMETLFPMGFIGCTAYFLGYDDRAGGEEAFEIWRYDPATDRSERVWKNDETSIYAISSARQHLVDRRGPVLLVARRNRLGRELGLLDLTSKGFSPVSPAGIEIEDFATDPEGNRVVYLSLSEAFEWRRTK